MKVEGIKTAKKISEHLYQIGKDIKAEDLLKVVRILCRQGKQLGSDYYYGRNELYYTEPSEMTKDEFHKILSITRESFPSIDNLLDNSFTRDQLVDHLSPLIKIKSSTTKGQLIQKALNEEILFTLFKELIVKEKCGKWKSYVEGKTLVPSLDKEIQLVFLGSNPSRKSLSNQSFTQFWILKKSTASRPEIRDYSTRKYPDSLFLNMKDKDELLLGLMRKLEQEQREGGEFELNIWQKELSYKNIGIAEAEIIRYENNIDKLSEYFGRRRGSKFETFSSGLKKMANKDIVKKHLGGRFLLSTSGEKVFIGKSLDKNAFEALATHLKLEYIEEGKIICRAQNRQTTETISALWEIAGEYSKSFEFRVLDNLDGRSEGKC